MYWRQLAPTRASISHFLIFASILLPCSLALVSSAHTALHEREKGETKVDTSCGSGDWNILFHRVVETYPRCARPPLISFL